MPLGRLRDHSRSAINRRGWNWFDVLETVAQQRTQRPDSAIGSKATLVAVASDLQRQLDEMERYAFRSREISLTRFDDDMFPQLPDHSSLSFFRFRKQDVLRMSFVLARPDERVRTGRNRYTASPLLITCIVLRLLATPARWKDMERLFGRHTSQLSDVFWEALKKFLSARVGLLMDGIEGTFWKPRFAEYARAVRKKSRALDTVVGFIDGMVIGIARPGRDELLQRVAYNGHKRKHALKFQATRTPYGLAMDLSEPMEGRGHDWTLYLQSGVNDLLPGVLNEVDGHAYCVYADSGYSARLFLYVPFSGSHMSAEKGAFNMAMWGSRVTVGWYFKEMKQFWTTLDFKQKLRGHESALGSLYVTGVLLTNFRNCVYPNSISQFFGCPPPELEFT